jgi:hypothetical protein
VSAHRHPIARFRERGAPRLAMCGQRGSGTAGVFGDLDRPVLR